MSHSSGEVIFKNGTVKYFEYNGTVDFAMRRVYDTIEELEENWRVNYDIPNCEHVEEDVVLSAHYGGGIEWESKVCRKCGFIIGNDNPYNDDEECLW